MFGLNDNANNTYADTTQLSASNTGAALPMDSAAPAAPIGSPTAETDAPSSKTPVLPPVSSTAQAPSAGTSTKPAAGMNDVSLENAYIDNGPAAPAKSTDQSPAKLTAASLVNSSTGEDELLKLKQQALQNLAPLVDHLEQSPEEKFKTTMMMIQASDNADLIPEAYEAANKIPDEKARAQALLDVINEINYFTQHSNGS